MLDLSTSIIIIFKAQVVSSLSSEVSWKWLLSLFDVTFVVRWLPCSSITECPKIVCFLLLSNKLSQISSLKTTSVFIISHLCSSKVQFYTVLCLESNKAEIKMLGELPSYLETQGKNLISGLFSFSKDLVPSGCRTEAPFSCWLLTGGHSQLLEAFFMSFSRDPLSNFT